MSTLLHAFDMGRYNWYVYTAYGAVFVFLFSQWFFPWRKWQHYLRSIRNKYE